MTSSAEVTVVGGGLVGLATAAELARRGRRVTVLEAEERLAAHQSGRNSGVVHSGLYYRPGSLKAELCTRGRELLYALCEEEGVAHRRSGKLVVATAAAELARLDELERRGRANGLAGLERLGAGELAERFPDVAGVTALWVPAAGIVDFVGVAAVLARRLSAAGGRVETGVRVTGIDENAPGGVRLETSAGGRETGFVVACAGLHADRLARRAGLDPGVRLVPFRGEYYQLAAHRRALVPVPVYPVPDPALPFLGVHLTPTFDGRVEAGPNAVLTLHRHGYRRGRLSLADAADVLGWPGFWRLARRFWRTGVAELARSASRRRFARDLARLVPAISADDLEPAGAGVRPQALDRAGDLVDDFRFAAGRRSLHVVNAPSPGATACLAIGRHLADRLDGAADARGRVP